MITLLLTNTVCYSHYSNQSRVRHLYIYPDSEINCPLNYLLGGNFRSAPSNPSVKISALFASSSTFLTQLYQMQVVRGSAVVRLLWLGVRIPARHGCQSLVSVVRCRQVEVSATGRSSLQRSPTDCAVSLRVIQSPKEWGGHEPLWAAAPRIYARNFWYNKPKEFSGSRETSWNASYRTAA